MSRALAYLQVFQVSSFDQRRRLFDVETQYAEGKARINLNGHEPVRIVLPYDEKRGRR